MNNTARKDLCERLQKKIVDEIQAMEADISRKQIVINDLDRRLEEKQAAIDEMEQNDDNDATPRTGSARRQREEEEPNPRRPGTFTRRRLNIDESSDSSDGI